MSLKKTVAIAAAAGALAAISVPAMAFENEAHGLYNLKWYMGNYEAGSSGYISPSVTSKSVNPKLNNFFEQRARLQYIAKASDDLRLVTHFEIDSVWGDRAQGAMPGAIGSTSATPVGYTGAFRNSGGAMESDAVNLETKHVYLDFKIPSTPTRVTAGIQPIKDAFKGIFIDVDIAGINTVSKLGAATVGAGYFRAYDQSYFGTGRARGMDTLQIGALSVDFDVNKDMKVGAAYYLYADNRNSYDPLLNATAATIAANAALGIAAPSQTQNTLNIHVLGVNFDTKLGALGLSGFAAMQTGVLKGATTGFSQGRTTYNAFAFNMAAKMAAGPGTFRTALLMTTGDDGRDGHNTAWQGVMYSDNAPATLGALGGNTYNEGGMFLLNRNALQSGGSNDMSLVYSSNNRDQGLWLYTLGYDAKIGAKAYANANLGFAWAAKDHLTAKPTDKTTGIRGGSNFQGAEINLETGYKMYDNLTVKAQAAYVMLGGYYKSTSQTVAAPVVGADPADPYTFRLGMSYAF